MPRRCIVFLCFVIGIFTIYFVVVDVASARKLVFEIADDGTEVNDSSWHEDGYILRRNCLGRNLTDETYTGGFRFFVEELQKGEQIVYARLKFSSLGSDITSRAKLLIEGILQESPTAFSSVERPSQKAPKTTAKVSFQITEPWLGKNSNEPNKRNKVPLRYSSPDIAPLINEILALETWGTGPAGKTLALAVKDNGSSSDERNVVYFENLGNATRAPVILEIYRTVHDTFIGKNLLGRVSDTSVTLHFYSLIETDIYIKYGTVPGTYAARTPQYLNQSAEQPIVVVLDSLAPDAQYYYRLFYRKTMDEHYQQGQEHTFHTQRPRGSTFSFAITADEHYPYKLKNKTATKRLDLYKQTLRNIAESTPDFQISLGDFAMTDLGSGRWIKTLQEAKNRYLNLREYLDDIAGSIPFFLVLGNHEGEVGWQYNFETPGQNTFSPAVLGTKARKEIFPNPYPDHFYAGNQDEVPEYGFREDYYAWEWGDALFVTLDPFWYTRKKPRDAQDNWEWTLGKDQYNWLYKTLHHSSAKWKFVFIHHLTSSCILPPANPFYGRGGIEVAKYKVAGQPSFEWGGEERDGKYAFDVQRPGWTHGPIHDMLVKENVAIVFHGHDHLFAKQDLDGIVYQACPQPSAIQYGYGHKEKGAYTKGVILPNAGHLYLTVNPHSVIISYIRSFLPGDGENGVVAYSYEIRDDEQPLEKLPDTESH